MATTKVNGKSQNSLRFVFCDRHNAPINTSLLLRVMNMNLFNHDNNSADDYVQLNSSTTVPVGTQLHWCTVSRPLPGSVLWTGNVRDAGEVN